MMPLEEFINWLASTDYSYIYAIYVCVCYQCISNATECCYVKFLTAEGLPLELILCYFSYLSWHAWIFPKMEQGLTDLEAMTTTNCDPIPTWACVWRLHFSHASAGKMSSGSAVFIGRHFCVDWVIEAIPTCEEETRSENENKKDTEAEEKKRHVS